MSKGRGQGAATSDWVNDGGTRGGEDTKSDGRGGSKLGCGAGALTEAESRPRSDGCSHRTGPHRRRRSEASKNQPLKMQSATCVSMTAAASHHSYAPLCEAEGRRRQRSAGGGAGPLRRVLHRPQARTRGSARSKASSMQPAFPPALSLSPFPPPPPGLAHRHLPPEEGQQQGEQDQAHGVEGGPVWWSKERRGGRGRVGEGRRTGRCRIPTAQHRGRRTRRLMRTHHHSPPAPSQPQARAGRAGRGGRGRAAEQAAAGRRSQAALRGR